MGIGMEKIIAEDLGIKHFHALGGECLAVNSGAIQGIDIIAVDAIHAFQGEDMPGRVRPYRFWHI